MPTVNMDTVETEMYMDNKHGHRCNSWDRNVEKVFTGHQTFVSNVYVITIGTALSLVEGLYLTLSLFEKSVH